MHKPRSVLTSAKYHAASKETEILTARTQINRMKDIGIKQCEIMLAITAATPTIPQGKTIF